MCEESNPGHQVEVIESGVRIINELLIILKYWDVEHEKKTFS